MRTLLLMFRKSLVILSLFTMFVILSLDTSIFIYKISFSNRLVLRALIIQEV
jgi:hypothetical protein